MAFFEVNRTYMYHGINVFPLNHFVQNGLAPRKSQDFTLESLGDKDEKFPVQLTIHPAAQDENGNRVVRGYIKYDKHAPLAIEGIISINFFLFNNKGELNSHVHHKEEYSKMTIPAKENDHTVMVDIIPRKDLLERIQDDVVYVGYSVFMTPSTIHIPKTANMIYIKHIDILTRTGRCLVKEHLLAKRINRHYCQIRSTTEILEILGRDRYRLKKETVEKFKKFLETFNIIDLEVDPDLFSVLELFDVDIFPYVEHAFFVPKVMGMYLKDQSTPLVSRHSRLYDIVGMVKELIRK